ncbi:MAG: ribose 5-phosphate isomerase B [Syntrophobacteraceae bacterium CG2_30_61_12]|nr:MAG: ribose 5-phosphate isomerase B [Syntrophobacteraceae bacterium CG2_30_61_12]
MKIIIGADHGGVELKDLMVKHLETLAHEVEDIGTHGPQSVDYPNYAAMVAAAVTGGRADRGILICGSGIGMSISANRFHGVRAALVTEPYAAKMSRRHNDSNVLCLGGRFLGRDLAFAIVDAWLVEPFEGDRHQRRLTLVDELARTRL